MTSGPLSHLTVLDLTGFLAGPYGTQMLGDLGARVIKVEPVEGDITRTTPPYFHKGDSAYYLSVNRNKESLVLNLKEARGRDVFHALAKRADLVIESFRPGVMKRLGLDYEALQKVNPKIVYCSLSGFGQDGPYRDKPAYDIIVQALSGGMSMTGEENGRPVRAGIPIGDLAAGMCAIIGSLAALSQARVSGKGSFVDISMLDCQISMLTYQAAYYLMSGEVPGLQGRGHRSLTTYRAYTCAGGAEIVVAANTEAMFKALCETVGEADIPSDERFSTRNARLRNRAELDRRLEAAFERQEATRVVAELQRLGVPAAPINSVDRALADPQVRHRQMVREIADNEGAPVRLVGNPVKIAGTPPMRFPPRLGADSLSVLTDILGLARGEIDELVGAGIVGIRETG
jgi:CoA:oxalate CoA-transferase